MSEEAQATQGQNLGGVARRQALCGIAALGLLGPAALAACSSDTAVGKPAEANPPPGRTGDNPPAAGAIATLASIPVGSGKILTAPDGQILVVVHEADGSVKAFSGKCTHKGVPVLEPANGVITCPAHNSKFSAADGSVTAPPAKTPLPSVAVQVTDGNIVLA